MMMKKNVVWNLRKFRLLLYVLLPSMLISCEPEDNELGFNLFPPSDTILVYTDTLYNIESKLVMSQPVFSSVDLSNPDADRIFLLGALNDTITGLSKAEIVTQLGFSTLGNFGAVPQLDSLKLFIYCDEVVGDTIEPIHILIYEFLDTIAYENAYFSDYDVTGKYDPEPLVDDLITPRENTYYEFDITDQDYINRVRQAIIDSTFITVDSMQQELLGLYITTQAYPGSASMMKIGMANPISRLLVHYLHDSVDIDTATNEHWDWYSMNFNEYNTQKINIFHHDISGTSLENKINAENQINPVLYAQGMAGVNTELRFPELDDLPSDITVNSAKLIFEVLPDSLSGILEDNYPQTLMLTNIASDSSREVVYDYLTTGSTYNFGRLFRSNKVSAFMDPLYLYKFNLGLHVQSILNGDLENTPLVLHVNQPGSTTKVVKLWSNYSTHPGSLRLELVYTKF